MLLRGSSGFHPPRSLAAPLTDCHGILFPDFGRLSLSLSASALIAFPPRYLHRTSLCFSPPLVSLFGFTLWVLLKPIYSRQDSVVVIYEYFMGFVT